MIVAIPGRPPKVVGPSGIAPRGRLVALRMQKVQCHGRAQELLGLAETEVGNKDVEQKVQAPIVELDARWNSGDAERFSRLFTVDHDFRIYGQRHHRSREALRDRYAQAWPETPRSVRHKSSVDTVRTLGAGVALVDGEVLVGEPDTPESGRAAQR